MHLNWSFLRDALWLGPERARAYRNILLAAQLLAAAAIVVGSHGGLDFDGRPIGTDFVSFWTASEIALSAAPAEVYDIATHLAAERQAFGNAPLNFTAFFYPPVFLLICLPLALLPYFVALVVWQAVTGALWFVSLGRFARDNWITVLAFPAVWMNLAHGQNGFLTAALFAGAGYCLDAQPIAAGLLLGCLIFKPHFLAMVPIVLIVGKRWRTAAIAVAMAALLCVLSVGVLGVDAWRAFLADTTMAREVMEQGAVGHARMQSLFAAVRLLGGGLTLAYGAQAVLAAMVVGLLAWSCRRAQDGQAIAAVLAAAALLVSPFLLVYDLVLLGIPLAWVWQSAMRTGFRPWEKTILAAGFILPLVSLGAASRLHLPLAPFAMLAVFGLVVRRINSPPTESR